MSVAKNESNKNEKISSIEAPEGGWGYVVFVGAVIVLVADYMFTQEYMILYNDFLNDIDANGKIFHVHSFAMLLMCLVGFVGKVALQRFSIRFVGMIGTTALALRWFLNYFITTYEMMFISEGILQGIANGLSPVMCYICLAKYFVKKNMMITTWLKTSIFTISLFAPTLMVYFLDNYGFRGTLLVMCLISIQSYLGMAMMLPIEKYYGKRKSYKAVDQDVSTIIPLMENNFIKNEIVDNILHRSIQEQLRLNKVDVESTGSETAKPKQSYWSSYSESVYFTLLTDPQYWLLFSGVCAGFVTDCFVIALLPQQLSKIYPKETVAIILTCGRFADLLGKWTLCFVNYFWTFRSQDVFFFGVIGTIICRICYLFVDSFRGTVAIVTLLYIMKSTIHVAKTSCYLEYDPDKFSACYVLAIGMESLVASAVGFSIGFLLDIINYNGVYICLIVLDFIFCIFPWTMQYLHYKITKKK